MYRSKLKIKIKDNKVKISVHNSYCLDNDCKTSFTKIIRTRAEEFTKIKT